MNQNSEKKQETDGKVVSIFSAMPQEKKDWLQLKRIRLLIENTLFDCRECRDLIRAITLEVRERPELSNEQVQNAINEGNAIVSETEVFMHEYGGIFDDVTVPFIMDGLNEPQDVDEAEEATKETRQILRNVKELLIKSYWVVGLGVWKGA